MPCAQPDHRHQVARLSRRFVQLEACCDVGFPLCTRGDAKGATAAVAHATLQENFCQPLARHAVAAVSSNVQPLSGESVVFTKKRDERDFMSEATSVAPEKLHCRVEIRSRRVVCQHYCRISVASSGSTACPVCG
jgi:hypothetical protein